MLVVGKGIRRRLAKICGNATNGKDNLAQFESGIGIFLPVDGHLLFVAVVRLYKLHGLHEHTARTAAGIVQDSIVRLQHFGNQIDDTFRRIEFALTFPFSKRKFAEKILINAPDDVILFVIGIDAVDLVQQGSQLCRVKLQAGIIVVRQSALQRRIIFLNRIKSRDLRFPGRYGRRHSVG